MGGRSAWPTYLKCSPPNHSCTGGRSAWPTYLKCRVPQHDRSIGSLNFNFGMCKEIERDTSKTSWITFFIPLYFHPFRHNSWLCFSTGHTLVNAILDNFTESSMENDMATKCDWLFSFSFSLRRKRSEASFAKYFFLLEDHKSWSFLTWLTKKVLAPWVQQAVSILS